MDQLSIDYAQEALREFGIYANRRKGDPKLVIWADGSGHIEDKSRSDIAFRDLEMLTKLLQKKNGTLTPSKAD